jgi:hypothetical protein
LAAGGARHGCSRRQGLRGNAPPFIFVRRPRRAVWVVRRAVFKNEKTSFPLIKAKKMKNTGKIHFFSSLFLMSLAAFFDPV